MFLGVFKVKAAPLLLGTAFENHFTPVLTRLINN
nr:MAG: hypothetical protein [Bacteriophage sp.]